MISRLLLSISFLMLLVSCSIKKISNIDYGSRIQGIPENPSLNIFTPNKKKTELKPVLIFVYGGNWNSGRKGIYNHVGRNFSKHDMVVVLPDYTKSPKAGYREMTTQIATSINWVKDHVSEYGGDPERIFVTGHSAGGHLVALATMDPAYGVDHNVVKGIILDDAAGLDMETYLKNNPPTRDQDYITTWTEDPLEWKKASPINFLTAQTPKIKMYTGSKSYPSIINSNKRFVKELQQFQPEVSIQWLDKKHVAMVSQLFWPWNNRFDEIESFMREQPKSL